MRMHFDLIDMQLLVNIAEEHSLTKGAERSFLSLPSASLRIKTFEETLGTKLLYRKKQGTTLRSEEHTSELQSLMRNSYAVFCLKKKKIKNCTLTCCMLNTRLDTSQHKKNQQV